ncbi:MAG: hypothetical protein EAY66_09715 [Sphingobacteriales bacterium]|nr:MAG: hypothetical protein EAY66_09715 [Sphingobacteriales bacterium]
MRYLISYCAKTSKNAKLIKMLTIYAYNLSLILIVYKIYTKTGVITNKNSHYTLSNFEKLKL